MQMSAFVTTCCLMTQMKTDKSKCVSLWGTGGLINMLSLEIHSFRTFPHETPGKKKFRIILTLNLTRLYNYGYTRLEFLNINIQTQIKHITDDTVVTLVN